jgi:regulator of protease activity HflC (stomatin/prohibitin superfamily)
MEFIPLLIFALIVLIALGLRVIQQYQKGVVFRLGKIVATKGRVCIVQRSSILL